MIMHGSPSKFLSIAFSFFPPDYPEKKVRAENMKFRMDGELTGSAAVKSVINHLNRQVNRIIFYILMSTK